MRVLYFSQDYTPHDHRFLEALAESDHEVFYLRLEDRGANLEARALPSGVQVVPWWGGNRALHQEQYPQAVEELRVVYERIRPDVVHAGPVQGPAYLSAMAGVRSLVTMSWGSDLLRDAIRGNGRRAATYAIQASQIVLTDSRVVTEKAIELGADPGRIVEFPWGVDLHRFRPGKNLPLRDRLGWEGALVLISTRSWEPIYGIEILIQGFLAAAREIPEIRLLMLGDGGLADRIRGAIREANMEDRVHFPGRVSNPDLPPYFSAADVYVTSSRSDGSSISLLEAMASGLPAVASDIPGNLEWVEPNRSGWLFPDGEAGALAATLIRAAAASQTERVKMGQRAREIAELRADWSRHVPRLLQAYQMAVGAHV